MKKIILTVFTILILFPSISLATSGACSSHLGVDCSVGPAYNGKVQCNDGWVNSSVYFYEMEECKEKSLCSYPTYSPCDVEYAKQQAQESAERINNNNRLMVLRGGILPPLIDWTQDPNYILCKDTQALYEVGQDFFKECLADESERWNENLNKETQIKLDAICEENNGEGSVWDESVKEGSDGLRCNPSQEQKDIQCKEKDKNSFYIWLIGDCFCIKGYQKNEKSICEKKIDTTVPVIFAPISPTANSKEKSNTIFTSTKLVATEKENKPSAVSSLFVKSNQQINENISTGGISNYNNEVNNMKIRLENNSANQVEQESAQKTPWYKKLFNWLFN